MQCTICGGKVYITEKIEANGRRYHKSCFKCSSNGCRLTIMNFQSHDGLLYCQKHLPKLSQVLTKRQLESATLAAAAVPHAHVHTAKNLIFTSILRYCHLASSLLYFFSVCFDSLCSHINNHICPEGKNLIFFSLLSSSHLSVL
ncbi:hypothetical protein VTP01DRAFT_9713 [Rhizomucor pusillus]|uniref:uncharacterized protein n=1 Tax=Rhizomucor pusillus TaxID=4840 RepID=UPI00374355F4